jgi:hypothetical protein
MPGLETAKQFNMATVKFRRWHGMFLFTNGPKANSSSLGMQI